jgi:hypothetical protein
VTLRQVPPMCELPCLRHKWGRVLEHRPRGDWLSYPRPVARDRLSTPRPQEAAPGGASTPTEGLTKRSDYLLMANQNPMGERPAIALTIPAGDSPFLRRVLTAARDGLREELGDFVDQLREPTSRLLREEAAYGKLIDSLDGAWIHPDGDLCTALSVLAEAIDRDNEYGRVVFEHAAVHGLLDQLEGKVCR